MTTIQKIEIIGSAILLFQFLDATQEKLRTLRTMTVNRGREVNSDYQSRQQAAHLLLNGSEVHLPILMEG
jgi:hypothetical protein